MKERFYRFMAGRYGTDQLSRFMLGTGVALMVLNLFWRKEFLNVAVVVLLALVYVRMFSTNIQKRYQENQKYLEYRAKAAAFFRGFGRNMTDLKANHIYRCPGCGQKIRIPRGRGKIIITCPKCRKEFTKKS